VRLPRAVCPARDQHLALDFGPQRQAHQAHCSSGVGIEPGGDIVAGMHVAQVEQLGGGVDGCVGLFAGRAETIEHGCQGFVAPNRIALHFASCWLELVGAGEGSNQNARIGAGRRRRRLDRPERRAGHK
jgi:hypothetical protein